MATRQQYEELLKEAQSIIEVRNHLGQSIWEVDAPFFPNMEVNCDRRTTEPVLRQLTQLIYRLLGQFTQSLQQVGRRVSTTLSQFRQNVERTTDTNIRQRTQSPLSDKETFTTPSPKEKATIVRLPLKQTIIGQTLTYPEDISDVLSASDSIRFKAYGLILLEESKVRLFINLEKYLVEQWPFSWSDIGLSYNGDLVELAERFYTPFGLPPVVKGQLTDYHLSWQRWFANRFLPIFITYLNGLHRAKLNYDSATHLLSSKPQWALKISEALIELIVPINIPIVGKEELEQLPIWQLLDSPFRNYALNNDPTSVEDLMNYLRHNVTQKTLENEADRNKALSKNISKTEERERQIAQQALKVKKQQEQQAKQHKEQTTSSTTQYTERLNENYHLGSTQAPGYDQAMANYAQGGAEQFTPETVSRNIESFSGGGGQAILPHGGEGGSYQALPLPRGDGTFEAHKEMLAKASIMAGVDPGLMATMAAIESSFDSKAKNANSSASGLFQFISGTWDEVLGRYGPKYGIPPRTSVFDPRANALMGAEYMKQNANTIKSAVDGPVGDTHLYAAHFKGAGGARNFFRALRQNPNANAVQAFPAYARANRSIYYNANGSPRTMAQVYEELDRRVRTRRDRYAQLAREEASKYTDFDFNQLASPTAPMAESDVSSIDNSSDSPLPSSTQDLASGSSSPTSMSTGIEGGVQGITTEVPIEGQGEIGQGNQSNQTSWGDRIIGALTSDDRKGNLKKVGKDFLKDMGGNLLQSALGGDSSTPTSPVIEGEYIPASTTTTQSTPRQRMIASAPTGDYGFHPTSMVSPPQERLNERIRKEETQYRATAELKAQRDHDSKALDQIYGVLHESYRTQTSMDQHLDEIVMLIKETINYSMEEKETPPKEREQKRRLPRENRDIDPSVIRLHRQRSV